VCVCLQILQKVRSSKYVFAKLPYRTVLESTAYRNVLTYRTHAYFTSLGTYKVFLKL